MLAFFFVSFAGFNEALPAAANNSVPTRMDDLRVVFSEFVSFTALVSVMELNMRRHAAKRVDSSCDRLKMSRITADDVSTKVVKLKTVRHWPDKKSVGKNVGRSHSVFLASSPDGTVAAASSCACPNPARRAVPERPVLGDTAPESFFNWAAWSNLKTSIVPFDETQRFAFYLPISEACFLGNQSCLTTTTSA